MLMLRLDIRTSNSTNNSSVLFHKPRLRSSKSNGYILAKFRHHLHSECYGRVAKTLFVYSAAMYISRVSRRVLEQIRHVLTTR